MNKKLVPTLFLVAFLGLAGLASANLTQVELQPQSSFTCNATGTIFYSSSNNQLMLCTSGTGSSPVLTSGGSGGTSASFSTLAVSGQTTLATASGNVSIGTTTMVDKLDVVGNLGIGGSSFNVGVMNGISDEGIAFPSTNNDSVRILGEYTNPDTSDGIFATGDNTTDGWKFRESDCCGGGVLDYIVIRRATPQMTFHSTSTDASSISVTNGFTSFASSGSNPGYSFSGGYVGIGTTSPATTLDVNGNINVGSVLYDRANTNYYVNPSGNIMPLAANLGGSISVPTQYIKVDSGSSYIGDGAPSVPSTATTTATAYSTGFYSSSLYNNSGYPSTYGYLMSLSNTGTRNAMAQMYFSWTNYGDQSGSPGQPAYVWVRTNRDSNNQFGTWQQIPLLQQNGDLNLGGSGYDYYGSGNLHVSGSVGIGTASPGSYKLQVSGTGNITGVTNIGSPSDTSGMLNVQTTGTDRVITINGSGGTTTSTWWIVSNPNYDSYAFNLWSATGGDLFRLRHNGSGYFTNGPIGIGTTAPTTAGLVVAANVSGAAVDVNNNRIINVGTPVNAADAATKSYVDSAVATGVSGGVTGTTNYIAKFTGTNTVGNSALYQSGSNIGIGTASPGNNLTVVATGASKGIDVLPTGYSSGATMRIVNPGTDNTVQIGAVENNNVQFLSNNSVVMTLTIGGNVGVGATNPQQSLEVSNLNNYQLRLGNGNGSSAYTYDIGRNGSDGLLYFYANQPGYEGYVFSGTRGEYMRINNGGNVGINTASPGTTLDVNGNIQASMYYDRSNTNYYINPSGSVMPYAANLNGDIYTTATHQIYSSYDGNLIARAAAFQADPGTTFGSLTGWSVNCSTGNNEIVSVAGPYGGQVKTWDVFNTGSSSVCGGTSEWIPADPRATYRFSIWIMEDSTNPTVYLGVHTQQSGDTLQMSSGSSNTNPYFWNGDLPTMNTWYLIEGYLYPYGVSNTSALAGGIYDASGRKVANIQAEFRFPANAATGMQLRFWNAYGTGTNNAWFLDPKIEEVNDFQNPQIYNNLGVPGMLTVGGSMYSIEHDNGTATGATTIDWSQSNTQTLVLGASPIALTLSNGQPGAHYTLALKQDATGSRLVTWPGNVRWSSGVAPTLTTTANKTDYVEFVYDGLSSTFDGVGFNANF